MPQLPEELNLVGCLSEQHVDQPFSIDLVLHDVGVLVDAVLDYAGDLFLFHAPDFQLDLLYLSFILMHFLRCLS